MFCLAVGRYPLTPPLPKPSRARALIYNNPLPLIQRFSRPQTPATQEGFRRPAATRDPCGTDTRGVFQRAVPEGFTDWTSEAGTARQQEFVQSVHACLVRQSLLMVPLGRSHDMISGVKLVYCLKGCVFW